MLEGDETRETSLPLRWVGAARLRVEVFAEVGADPRALIQALLVVLAGGLGRGLGAVAEEGWLGLVGSPAVGVIVWLVAAVLVWGIAVEFLGHRSDFPTLVRVLGFAAAPLVTLSLCAVLPRGLSQVWWVAVHLWATLAFGKAAREALEISPVRALCVCVAALAIALVLLFLAGAVLLDYAFLD
jgi:hypothetical protein